MVGVIRRLHKLKAILGVRHGPGAAVLPQDVSRIHMEFAHLFNDGHMGPRKFWRTSLPRLKYWNPAIPMIVNRVANQEGPATLSIYFREPGVTPKGDVQQQSSSSEGFSKAPAPAEGERVVQIDMKGRHSDQILSEFMAKSGAVPVTPTAQEEMEIREAEELEMKAKIDKERVRKMVEESKREKRLIQQAQSEAAAIKAAL
ncbi:CI-B8 domain-containing protein [Podospora australis]|uniref:CI-B8 domain-containing protein n=1 Tax=Podospora australis TaxID=1536484 RepID=A0AAN7AI67_9PEZI|nr:CI-B8 domain-containing protein [Podospora australis]